MRTRFTLEQLERRDLPSTYYVATTGNNAASGAEATPWSTLQYAVDHVKAGDTIEVESGTYAGCRIGNNGTYNSASGTSTAEITLEAAPNATVVVNKAGSENYHGSDIEIENFNSTVEYWTIKGIECEDSSNNAGIDIRTADYITIDDCTCYDNYNWGIFLAFSSNDLIENNTCSYSVHQHGIYDSNSASNDTIINNTCDNNHDCGIEVNGDESDGGCGYMSDNLIAGNIIYDNGAGGGAAINCDGIEDSTIENNLIYGNKASGIVLYQSCASEGSMDNVVVNNTIVMMSGSRWAVDIADSSTGNTLLNNIIFQEGTSGGTIEISANSLTGFVCDYNIFNTSPEFSINAGTSNISLSKWQSETSQDENSFSAAKLGFVNYSKNDYQLSSTSVCIDAGTTTDEPTTDLLGNTRSTTSDDIGAYTYVASK